MYTTMYVHFSMCLHVIKRDDLTVIIIIARTFFFFCEEFIAELRVLLTLNLSAIPKT